MMRPFGLVDISANDGVEIYVNPFQVSHIIDASADRADRRCLVHMRNGSAVVLPCKAFQVARKLGIVGKQSTTPRPS